MTDYRKYSFWLENSGDDLTPRQSLLRSTDVDVAILGGGYTGLWTAYYLLRTVPGLKVAVLEKEIVGYGASGRNGGWCSSKFPVTPRMLEHRYGRERARALMLAMCDAVDDVSRVCQQENFDASFTRAEFSRWREASITSRCFGPRSMDTPGWGSSNTTNGWTPQRRSNGYG
jgi:succinate dehydrogenase/fumarate reductase flavoprotein subunit